MNYTLERTQSEKDLYLNIKNILLKIFIRTHMRFIIISILKLNFFILKSELSLFKKTSTNVCLERNYKPIFYYDFKINL